MPFGSGKNSQRSASEGVGRERLRNLPDPCSRVQWSDAIGSWRIARRLLRIPIVVRRVNHATGSVMVGIGVAVVTTLGLPQVRHEVPLHH